MSTEYREVEKPLIEQLTRMGWAYLEGDTDLPERTERSDFREAVLQGRLMEAVGRINRLRLPWLTDADVQAAVLELLRLEGSKLLETNRLVLERLIHGTTIPGPDGKGHTLRFLDFENPHHNDFLAINQFRVNPPTYRAGAATSCPTWCSS